MSSRSKKQKVSKSPKKPVAKASGKPPKKGASKKDIAEKPSMKDDKKVEEKKDDAEQRNEVPVPYLRVRFHAGFLLFLCCPLTNLPFLSPYHLSCG